MTTASTPRRIQRNGAAKLKDSSRAFVDLPQPELPDDRQKIAGLELALLEIDEALNVIIQYDHDAKNLASLCRARVDQALRESGNR